MSRNQATAVLRDNAEDLRSYVVPTLATAGAKTREVVAPALATAGMKTRDMMVDEVLPRVKDGIAATEPWRAEAARRGSAAAQALAGHAMVEPKSRRWGRKALMLTLLGAGAAAAWKAWKLPHDSDDWMPAETAAPPAAQAGQKKAPAEAPLHAG
ncbi:MAG TPA: hypothetical protein VGJ14_03615 [Sporichthyaceae bacterium]|jgi:uncharacterized membrane protein YebE (DUF533 family)